MNKIVRGKIKSIDASIGKREGYCYEANIDTLEYIITLDDGKKYQTNCSIEDFKVGDLIDIAVFKKIKEHVKEDYENYCIIINKETAKKILFDSKFHNSENYLLFIMSFLTTAYLTFEIVSRSIFDVIPLLFMSIMIIVHCYITAITIKGAKNKESLFSEEEYNLMKKYRDGKKLNNSNIYMSDIKNIKEKTKVEI